MLGSSVYDEQVLLGLNTTQYDRHDKPVLYGGVVRLPTGPSANDTEGVQRMRMRETGDLLLSAVNLRYTMRGLEEIGGDR